jgi:MoaA/NifB/PqqE/SkfB family radical SAM enzyme
MKTLFLINEKVFWRIEEDRFLFILKPREKQEPLIRLFKPPANEIWSDLLNGTITEQKIKNDKKIINQLLADGIISSNQTNDYTELDDDVLTDPWFYQFNTNFKSSPWFILWEITNDCPLDEKCLFCYENRKTRLNRYCTKIDEVVNQLDEAHIPWVTLLGGEPLMHPQIYEIIRKLKSKNIFVKIITNGVLVTKENSKELGNAGVDQIAISFDGLSKNIHELSRGRDSFRQSLNALYFLQDNIPLVSISLTVSNKVLEQIDNLPIFCKEHNIYESYLSPLRTTPETKLPSGIRGLSTDELNYLNSKIGWLNNNGSKTILVKNCTCGKSSGVIDVDNNLRPCPFSQDLTLGNIVEDGFIAIWSKISNQVKKEDIAVNSTCFRQLLHLT